MTDPRCPVSQGLIKIQQIPQWTHTGASNPVAFHNVIGSYLPVGGQYSAAQISQGLSAVYTELRMPELFNVIAPLIK